MWSLGEGCGVPDEFHLIDRLSRRGIEIEYLIPEPKRKTALFEHEGLRYHTYPNIFESAGKLPGPLRGIFLRSLFTRRLMPVLLRLIAEHSPDLVLGYSYFSLSPLEKAARKTGLPTAVKFFGVMYLNHIHLPWMKYRLYNHEQILALRNRVGHYIVLNDGTQGREALIRRGIPADRITYLPNGMELGWADMEVDRGAVRDSYGLPKGMKLVVTHSRLVRSKRIDIFLRAMAAVEKFLLDESAIVICGAGPELDNLRSLAEELGIIEKVHFTGAVKYNDIPLLLKSCDFFVGTNELTNMSMPPCEALLCGLPVVAFDIAGTSEAVIDGETGLLVENGNIEGLTEAIERLLSDPGLVARLGSGASSFAKDNFMSWDQRTSRELELFDRIVSGG